MGGYVDGFRPARPQEKPGGLSPHVPKRPAKFGASTATPSNTANAPATTER